MPVVDKEAHRPPVQIPCSVINRSPCDRWRRALLVWQSGCTHHSSERWPGDPILDLAERKPSSSPQTKEVSGRPGPSLHFPPCIIACMNFLGHTPYQYMLELRAGPTSGAPAPAVHTAAVAADFRSRYRRCDLRSRQCCIRTRLGVLDTGTRKGAV